MSAQGARESELVFCHACENEWLREQHGLECPQCHSDVVEIVSPLISSSMHKSSTVVSEPNHDEALSGSILIFSFQIDERHDPRDNHITISDDDDDDSNDATTNLSNDSLPRHPLHHHNPWRGNPPDPDDGDIEHVEWNPAPGVHFTRTSFRSITPGGMDPRPGQSANDGLTPLFQNISSLIFQGAANVQGRTPGFLREAQARSSLQRQNSNPIHRPAFASPSPLVGHHHHHIQHHHGAFNPGDAHDGRTVFTATGRWSPNEGAGPLPGDRDANNLHAYVLPFLGLQVSMANAVIWYSVLATLLQSMQAGMMHQADGQPNGMHTFLSSLMGNGAHGDAVYTEEALDRIVTQLMDQTGAHSAPGPASAAAIASLPKQKADGSVLGENGKAECSVCMDAVEIGDEVTVLPCKHWFHGDCVGAWLREHDTCPHCRQGIMPKNGPANADTPRSPDQAPQNDLNNHPPLDRGPPPPLPRGHQAPIPTAFLQPAMQQSYMPGGFSNYAEPRNYVIPPGQQQQPSSHWSSPPSPQQNRNEHSHRRRLSARDRSSGDGGEGSNSGQGVSAWFRNLRGGNSSGDR